MKDIQSSEWVTYVPEWEDNREDEDPITAELRPLTMAASGSYATSIKTEQVHGFRGQTRDNSVAVSQKQFRDNCRNITNLRVDGKEITTPQDLLGTRMVNGLVLELMGVINGDLSMLREGEAKNFASQSDGSKKAAGTAKPA